MPRILLVATKLPTNLLQSIDQTFLDKTAKLVNVRTFCRQCRTNGKPARIRAKDQAIIECCAPQRSSKFGERF